MNPTLKNMEFQKYILTVSMDFEFLLSRKRSE